MASTSEIRKRISSVRDTQKITRAMYLISQSKLRRAKRELENTRPYFRELEKEIKRIFRVDSAVESRYFYPAGENESVEEGTYGCLVITADKGLAGAYNQNVLRRAQQLLQEHPDTRLYVVGEYGRHWFQQKKIPIERSFLYTAQNPTMHRAREIAELLLEPYEAGTLSKIFVIFTDMKNGLEETVRLTRLLPLHRREFGSPPEEQEVRNPFEFTPSVEAVLDHVMHSTFAGYVYSALVDSFCAEQSARMSAMNAANQNAEELLESLSVQYNRARQAAITQEITEVSAGERAQRSKKEQGV